MTSRLTLLNYQHPLGNAIPPISSKSLNDDHLLAQATSEDRARVACAIKTSMYEYIIKR